MKWMKKLRLINWHYFTDETMEFGRQTLISGQNGAGKSTIIDALQVLFIADLRLIKFNSSAHDEAKRNLLSYLRGKIGSEEKGFVREGDFTTYIVAEFRDDTKRESFVVGVVIDVFRDQNYEEEFFILNHLRLEEVDFIKPSGHLRTREEFRQLYGHEHRSKSLFERNKGSYQKAFLARMGQMQDRFFSIFTKAISFKPIQNVREFVYDYILDERELQLEVMKQNFEIHENYRREMELLQERKDRLQEINDKFAVFSKWRETAITQDFVIRRLKYLLETENLEKLEGLISGLEEKVAHLQNEQQIFTIKENEAEAEAEKAYSVWQNNDEKKRKEELEEKITGLEIKAKEKERLLQVFQVQLDRQIKLLESLEGWGGNEYWTWRPAERQLLEKTWGDLSDILESNNKEVTERANYLRHAGVFLQEMYEKFSRASFQIEDLIGKLNKDKEDLEQKINDLEKNKQRPYPPSVTRLKKLLEERLASRSQVFIFCEETEILDETWRNAIEGYLHTQKFDLLVESQVFSEALALYEREKYTHGLEGVGLVDTEKEARYKGTMEKGSLAELLQADHPIIQARIEHLLGRVMKAINEQNLRSYKTAVTASCMSYQNLVARQIPMKRYEVPYIGSQALVRQLEIYRSQLTDLEAELKKYTMMESNNKSWLDRLSGQQFTLEKLADQADLPEMLRSLVEEKLQAEKDLQGVDVTVVEHLEQEYRNWKEKQQVYKDKVRELAESLVEKRKDLDDRKNAKTLTEKNADETLIHWQHWNEEYGAEEGLLQKAEQRWLEAERQQVPTPRKIENWEGNYKGNITRSEQEAKELWKLRSAYNTNYGLNTDPDVEDNQTYRALFDEIRGVDIPQYQKKLEDALRESEEEFKSHFVYKLREAIELAHREFNRLNYALKNFPFHQDSYHFEVKASDRYRKFYDVIMDPNIVEKGSIFDTGTDQKVDTLHELFDLLIRGEIGEQDEFTDYRRYLDFDIVVQSAGSRYSFSQVLREKSGGETQTPFYIAILASFHHLYSSDKTMRLVVFDEAFNKMDEQRIQTSLRLIKQMNLQLIAAVPDEKMQHMVPEVTTTLLVNNINFNCFVDMIDKLIIEDDADGYGTGEPESDWEEVHKQDSLFAAQ
ncbi:MAG: AAA family ATPase [Peptococcaceae bacterium]|nr:AAA family ATPase [Peptococcaceae bacterium]